MEIFLPTSLEDLLDLDIQEKDNCVTIRILVFNRKKLPSYICEEYKRVEDMIADGFSIKDIKCLIDEGLIRLVSVFPEGKEN